MTKQQVPATFTLKDLKGRPGPTLARFARSRTAALRLMRTEAAVTAADSNGAINLWRDKDGRLHAEFHRRLISQDHSVLPSLVALDRWLKLWFPQMRAEEHDRV